jgi:hypothetical protein
LEEREVLTTEKGQTGVVRESRGGENKNEKKIR